MDTSAEPPADTHSSAESQSLQSQSMETSSPVSGVLPSAKKPTAVERPRITDSPWFWAYLFSSMALLALFVIDGKYQHRQTHLEDEYRFGTRTLDKPLGATLSDGAGKDGATVGRGVSVGTHPAASPGAGSTTSLPEQAPLTVGPQPLTHELLISLWPLRLVAAVAMMVSCVALQWSYLKRRAAARRAETQSAP